MFCVHCFLFQWYCSSDLEWHCGPQSVALGWVKKQKVLRALWNSCCAWWRKELLSELIDDHTIPFNFEWEIWETLTISYQCHRVYAPKDDLPQSAIQHDWMDCLKVSIYQHREYKEISENVHYLLSSRLFLLCFSIFLESLTHLKIKEIQNWTEFFFTSQPNIRFQTQTKAKPGKALQASEFHCSL